MVVGYKRIGLIPSEGIFTKTTEVDRTCSIGIGGMHLKLLHPFGQDFFFPFWG
jgi:hypothetical protein